MKRLIVIVFTQLTMFNLLWGQTKMPSNIKSIYDFSVKSLQQGNINLADFKGKKILIVNTASKCGYTPQYTNLEKLYESHKDKLVIIGFPANDFLFQEPDDDKEIERFCKLNYGVSFPMASKITVKGRNKHPLYLWLTDKKYNHFKDSKVSWNFQKYLINETGQLINIFEPEVDPLSKEILDTL